MGKKTSRKISSETPVQAEEEKVVEDSDKFESDLVKLKKENAKVMAKNMTVMESEVKKNIDVKQVISAVKALQKFFKSKQSEQSKAEKKQLLEDDDAAIHVNFTLRKVPEKPTPRPLQITVPKPFHSKSFDTRICLIVKDPEADFRKQIEDMDIPCIAEVIGFDRLKRDFRQFKDKRQLLKDYDVFLADIRIYKMLPEMMGKEFYSKKAFPCPIKVHGFDSPKGLKEQLNKASECAYYTMGNGPNYSVRVGMVSQDSKDIAKNMEVALGQAVGYTTCWDGIDFSQVSQVGLRISSHPIDLPVYNNLEQSDIDAYMKSS